VTTAAQSARLKSRFLPEFAKHGTVTHAAQVVGVGRRTVYDWLARDAEFRAAFAEAEQQAIDSLEREAVRRALEGTDEPVYQGGKKVGSIRKYSDTLLIFLLKGNRPSKYRERVDVTFQARETAERLAAEIGVTADELLAEAERIAGKAG
jgi:transposase